MAEFTFNARQYFDFSQDQDDLNGDSYFEIDEENVPPDENAGKTHVPNGEVAEKELSETESDCFYSPLVSGGISNSTVYLRGRIRKSLSLTNLTVANAPKQHNLQQGMEELSLNSHQPERPSSACSYNSRTARVASKEHINRLAQPKRYASQDNLSQRNTMTLAEAVVKFQAGTPKRFRSKPSPNKIRKASAPTVGHTPKFLTSSRARPVTAISKEEQERREFEEAKKFKIKAHPINKKVLRGPLKPQVDKKPPTTVEPFKLTEVRKRCESDEPDKAPVFKAQPLPKSLHKPFKLQQTTQPVTKPETPTFLKKLTKTTPKKVEKREEPPKPGRLTATQLKPFSFEHRDKLLMKKKEEFINKVLEEEKKAREFHARPPPKAILRSRNGSQDQISEAGSSKKNTSLEELDTAVFKARPAKVLAMKPFEPKRDDNHVVIVEEFQFATDQRLEARHKFQERVKEKEAEAEAFRRQKEEELRRQEEEEVLRLRKQMEPKAQPIKKYKEVVIVPANKCTEPISPKFRLDKIRNKENIKE